tara:strand:+ start:206 stop:715 length:510 start_codon:yes stop_codon:yes gene_type:complete
MRLGSKIKFLTIFTILFYHFSLNAENKITSTPLINLNEIKPSFEDVEEKNEIFIGNDFLKRKTKGANELKYPHAVLIGLDKITAKSTEIKININEVKKYGPLEIKILKCGQVRVNNRMDDVAYMQVKDLTKNENEKVFIFNGWTFSSDPHLTPFDHAIYDLQLLNCYKA